MAKKFVDGHGLIDERKPIARHNDCESLGTADPKENPPLDDEANVTGGYGSAPNKGSK